MSKRREALLRSRQRTRNSAPPTPNAPLGSRMVNGVINDLKILGNTPFVQKLRGAQQQFIEVTDRIPGVKQLEALVGKAAEADDKLPSSVLARGGMALAQDAGNAINLDPRIAAGMGLLIGGVYTSGPKKGHYKASPTLAKHPNVGEIEDYMEHAWKQQAATRGTQANIPPVKLSNGQILSVKNQGLQHFKPNIKGGLTPKLKPAAPNTTYQSVSDVVGTKPTKPAPKVELPKEIKDAVVKAQEYGLPPQALSNDNVLRLLEGSDIPVTSILDPRYVARTQALVDSSTKHWDKLKTDPSIVKVKPDGKTQKAFSASRVLSSFMGQPTPDFYKHISSISPEQFDDFDTLSSVYRKLNTDLKKMSSNEMYGPRYIEGHHPVQVESVAKASKHLSVPDRLKFLDTLRGDYTYGGNEPSDMFALSATGHQGNYIPKSADSTSLAPPLTAHQSIDTKDLLKEGFTPKTGDNWSTIDFTQYKTPKSLAKAFWQQSGEPQVRLSEIAFDQRAERQIRQQFADAIGKRERELYTMREQPRNIFKTKIDPATMLKIIQDSYYPGRD